MGKTIATPQSCMASMMQDISWHPYIPDSRKICWYAKKNLKAVIHCTQKIKEAGVTQCQKM